MLARMSTTNGAPRPRDPIVALDGPGSSGKTSVGAAVAGRLGFRFCDTGLLYRAVTFAAVRRGIAESDAAGLVALVGDVRLEADSAGRYGTVTIDGVDVTSEVQAPDVDAAVSGYARVPEVRSALLDRQREIAGAGGVVMAGRDIGTVVLPAADVKVYLDASVEERARRRAEERDLVPDSPAAVNILAQLRARDERDASRAVAPLRRASDAVVVRTDGVGFEASVDLVVDAIRTRLATIADVPPAPMLPAGSGTRPTRRQSAGSTPIATRITPLIRVVSFLMRLATALFTRVDLEGDLSSIPRDGAVLIVANHASNADPVLIGGYLNTRLGRPLNWMGKREVFEWPLLSWLARHGGVHPVDRGAADVEAFRTAMRILGAGHILVVFPEGTRSPDGRLHGAKDGVAVLAARSGAVIVPVGLGNADLLWPRGRRLPMRTPRVSVHIGEPFVLAAALAAETAVVAATAPLDGTDAAGSVASRRRSNAAGTDLIMRRIAALLPARQRGVYGDDRPD